MAFQQKWIFLNKVLHEMKIQFPSAELVGKGVKESGQELLGVRALDGRVELSSHYPHYHLSHHRMPVSRSWMISIGP